MSNSAEANSGLQLTHQQIRSQVSDKTKLLIAKLSRPNALRSVKLYSLVYLAIAILIASAIYIDKWYFTALVVVLIAGRQHSLYILNHDASHYSLFEHKGLNKLFGTVFSNWIMFYHPEAWSFVQWRRVHMLHHKHLFTESDPNYVGRKNKGDTDNAPSLPRLAWQVFSGGLLNIRDFFIGRQSYISDDGEVVSAAKHTHFLSLFFPYRNDTEMESERLLNILFFISSLSLVHFLGVWEEFLIYWILPMYTIYPMILRFHDLTEHRWEVKTNAVQINTRSRQDGWLFKLFFTGLSRGFHCEHHIYPRVAVVNLAIINELLVKEKLVSTAGAGVIALFKELADNSDIKMGTIKNN